MAMWRRLFACTFFPLLIFPASCGGNTKSDETSGGRSGSGGTAGSGGASGSSGSAGASDAGRLAERCLKPADSGNCFASNPSYFHNRETGLCEPFTYGGCGGNDNRFGTLAECQAACRGGSPDMDACQSAADCMVSAAGCCGGCDNAGAFDFVALNKRFQSDYVRIKGCESVTCGACPSVDELSTTAQYFVPACEAGQCTVVDIRQNAITACTADSECVLRDGSGCCEQCDSSGLIAINSNGDFRVLCSGPLPPCLPCMTPIDPQFAAVCRAGRCTVTRR